MTSLGCNAKNCSYNVKHKCTKNDIKVQGSTADRKADTCCASFKEDSCSAKNHTGSPNDKLNIMCYAKNCVYNDNHDCTADNVEITGAIASEYKQTSCSSFKNK